MNRGEWMKSIGGKQAVERFRNPRHWCPCGEPDFSRLLFPSPFSSHSQRVLLFKKYVRKEKRTKRRRAWLFQEFWIDVTCTHDVFVYGYKNIDHSLQFNKIIILIIRKLISFVHSSKISQETKLNTCSSARIVENSDNPSRIHHYNRISIHAFPRFPCMIFRDFWNDHTLDPLSRSARHHRLRALKMLSLFWGLKSWYPRCPRFYHFPG